jgi:hypothetical protein
VGRHSVARQAVALCEGLEPLLFIQEDPPLKVFSDLRLPRRSLGEGGISVFLFRRLPVGRHSVEPLLFIRAFQIRG